MIRQQVDTVISNFRTDIEDTEKFRLKHEDLFWNLIWYCYHRQLDLTFF